MFRQDLCQLHIPTTEVSKDGTPWFHLPDEVKGLESRGVLLEPCFLLEASAKSSLVNHDTAALSIVDEVLTR
jgi:hypothetical protein